MPLALIAPGKLSPTDVAGEGLLARVGADVGGEMVTAAEVAHADATLEGLLAGVDADVARELVGAGEATVAGLDRAGVRAFVGGRLAGPVGVLAHAAGFDELGLVSGVEGLQVLGARLRGKGLDGRQRSERRLLGTALQALEGLLVGGAQAQVPLLLWKQVVRDHGDLEATLGRRVGGRRVLERGARGAREGLALRLREDVTVRRGEGRRGRVNGAAVVGLDGTAQGWALRGGGGGGGCWRRRRRRGGRWVGHAHEAADQAEEGLWPQGVAAVGCRLQREAASVGDGRQPRGLAGVTGLHQNLLVIQRDVGKRL